jgi:hypothetical protein
VHKELNHDQTVLFVTVYRRYMLEGKRKDSFTQLAEASAIRDTENQCCRGERKKIFLMWSRKDYDPFRRNFGVAVTQQRERKA